MAHKAINWAAIKKRYLLGEKPKAIAEDYGLTSQQVRSRAHNEKWVEKKETILNRVEQKAESELDEIHSLYGELIKGYGKDFVEARRAGLAGLTVQDGEGFPNKMVQDVIKTGLASYMEKQKHANKVQLAKLDQPSNTADSPAGIIISPDV